MINNSRSSTRSRKRPILQDAGAERTSWQEDQNEAVAGIGELETAVGKSKSQHKSPSNEHRGSDSNAITVRVRETQTLITAGPFAETNEQLGGYFLIEVSDLDRAIEIAARLPSAKKGTVEVRPVYPLADLPAERFGAEAASQSRSTHYLLLCYDDAEAWNQLGSSALQAAQAEAAQLAQRLAERQQDVSASPLHSATTATSVRIRGGQKLITDGPFSETREFLGGYYQIAVNDRSEALSIAAQHPGARYGCVEIRQVYDLSNSSID